MFCGAGRYASTRLRCGRTGRYNVISERIGQAILEDDGRACVQLLSKKWRNSVEEMARGKRRSGISENCMWRQCFHDVGDRCIVGQVRWPCWAVHSLIFED